MKSSNHTLENKHVETDLAFSLFRRKPRNDRIVMKTCSKCKVSKDVAGFSKNMNTNDGFDYRCKSCLSEYRQTDSQKAYRKAYSKGNARKEYQEALRQTDAYKEKHRTHQKEYRLRKKAAADLVAGA